jgi:hypothetical protein
MASTNSTRTTGRLHRRHFYHWRLCRFEILEVRQVLSASVGIDPSDLIFTAMDIQKAHQTAGPVGYTPDQIRQAYGFNSASFTSTFVGGSALKVGEYVFGPDIPVTVLPAKPPTIIAISGNKITLSAAATGTANTLTVFGSLFSLTTAVGSHTATLTSTVGLTVGEAVGSTNFASGTTIGAIVNATTITLSNPAKATTAPGKPVSAVIGIAANLATTKNIAIATVQTAIGIPANGKGQTIAIIDAGNDPDIISDTNAFSLQFGLPEFNVTGAPTLKVVNQFGSSGSVLPVDDQDVSVETSLDVEWAHAIAPEANILLVESNDLLGAITYARSAPGVSVVSLSYSIGEAILPATGALTEFIGESGEDSVFTTPSGHQGVSFTVSAGDDGGPATWPSASPNVLSVGGTTLKISATNNWSGETVWNTGAQRDGSGGGGLSGVVFYQPGTGLIYNSSETPLPLEPAPNYQASLGYTTRGTPDVSYDADPNTGFAVYDSFAFGAATPWAEIGGTSAGAPQWAGLIADVNQGRALIGKSSLANVQSIVYKLPSSDFHDIIAGNNNYAGALFPNQGFNLGITGNAAGPGYDLASGLGTPIANLVIRDLVAFNGSTFVTPTRVATSIQSTGINYFPSKIKSMTADGGSDGSAGMISVADASDGTVAANDSNSLGRLSVADDNADLAVLPTGSLRLSDSTALQFASDWQDDGSSLSHHSHGIHDTDADYSDAALDNIFAEI